MKKFILKHKIGFISAFVVGLISVLPQIIFIASLGDQYRGIHMFATPNENAYIAIMQEIVDGHPMVASMPFFEYKDKVPLLPATIPWLYALPTLIFGVSIVSTVIASKFILPAILFFLIYLLVYRVTDITEKDKWGIFNAVTAGTLVVFGFDLVDYRSSVLLLLRKITPEGFIIWTRPVNPISGAIFLFIFLICLWGLIQKNKKRLIYIFIGGIFLAFMMASYVFSWTIAVVVAGLAWWRFLLKRDYKIAKDILMMSGLGMLFSLPYWLNMLNASKMPFYKEAAARIGFFYTRTPHFNKFLFAVGILFVLITIINYFKKKKLYKREWWWLSLFFILGGFIVYNQQIITGREIWYYHYVFYTIPLGYIALIFILWFGLKIHLSKVWKIIIILFFAASSMLGVYTQYGAYKKQKPEFFKMQEYREVFDFFNNQAQKDCVVLSNEAKLGSWSNLIPAFTHCNSYYSGENQSVLANPQDFYYRYLAIVRLRGVAKDGIEKYIDENKSEVQHALQYQLQRTLGFPDPRMEKRLANMPKDYKELLEQDFYTQLSKFRIDYILSEGELGADVVEALPELEEIRSINGIFIYKI